MVFKKIVHFSTVIVLTFVLVFLPVAKADSTYFPVVQGVQFFQDWSVTTLILLDDNWATVPSILGFRGDDLTTVTATDDGSGTPVDVIANQASPNTQATGGVAEFDGIANPTIALQGSGTADAPFIEIRIDTTNCTDPGNRLTMSYLVRDIDGSADNAVQPVALHFRVGAAGNFTNVPAAFIADATTGPSIATLVTSVGVVLPTSAQGVALLHLRIMTTNAVGNDEWVGIDDIRVACALQPTAAGVSISGRVMTADGRGISKARITITGNSLVEPRLALTGAFGYYTIDGLQAGETYVVTVGSKRFTFQVPSRVINLDDNVTGLDFVADP